MTEWVIDPELRMPVRRSKRNMGKVVDYRPFYYEFWRPEKYPPKTATVKTVLMRNQCLGALLSRKPIINNHSDQKETPSPAKHGVKRRIEDDTECSMSQKVRAAPERPQTDTSSRRHQLRMEKVNSKQSRCEKKNFKVTESLDKPSYAELESRVQTSGANGTTLAILPRGGARCPTSQISVLREEGDANIISSEHSSLFGLSLNSPARRQNRRFPTTPRPHGNSFDSDDFEEDNDEQHIFADRVEVAADDDAITATATCMVREQTERRYDPVNGPPEETANVGEIVTKYRRKSTPTRDSSNCHLRYGSHYNHECTATTPRTQHAAQESRSGTEIFNYILELASGKGNQQERLDEIRRCAQSFTLLNHNSSRENDPEAPSTSSAYSPHQSDSHESFRTAVSGVRESGQQSEPEDDIPETSPKTRKRRRRS